MLTYVNRIQRGRCFAALCALGVVSVQPSELRAQIPTCAQAKSTVLAEGQTRSQLQQAWSVIVKCGDDAPPTIVKALRLAVPFTVKDTLARHAAWTLADRRLTDSVIFLAKDAAQSSGRRKELMRLLAHYYNPVVTLYPLSASDSNSSVLRYLLDAEPLEGNQPMVQSDRDRALSAIVWMKTNDPSLEVRKLAAAVAYQIPPM